MSKTYADFVAMLGNHMVTDITDPDFLAILPRIVEAAEMRIYRDLDLPGTRKTTSPAVLTNGVPTIARPADMVFLRDAWITSGNTRIELQRRDETFLRGYWPDPTQTGTPKYLAVHDDGTLQLAPTPTTGLTYTLFYTYRPTPLSGDNPTTWITTFYPDLMDYAALVYAAGYSKNFGAAGAVDDQQGGVTWAALYTSALATAKMEMSLDKSFGPFDHTPTPPAAANTSA